MKMQLLVKKLSENAIIPTRGSIYAAGLDLYSSNNYTIPAHGKELVKTDIAIAIPYGFYGRVAPRSGLAWKNFIDIGAGVIDSDYRGNVGVVTFNHADSDFQVKKGDRIAQLIIEQISLASAMQVESFEGNNHKNDKLQVKLLSSDAQLPIRGSKEAAGYDLFSSKAVTVPPHSSSIIPTDILVNPPIGTYCRISPRSGMSWKNFTDISAGVITYGDITNPLNIYLHNHNNNELKIEKGERVAQLILESYEKVNIIKTDKLDDTNRGANGFGSTGISLTDKPTAVKRSDPNDSPQTDKKRKLSDSSLISDLYYIKEDVAHEPTLKNDVIKLYSKGKQILSPFSKNIVKTGIFTSIPNETYGRLSCTPKLAEQFVDGGAGVIDSDYRGEIGVILFNHSPNEVTVDGEVCNMTIEKISLCSVKEVEELTDTDRGAGGFGSTGK